jgi:hypothetical protein
VKVLTTVMAAVGCFGALICLVVSGVAGAVMAPANMFNPWDYGAKLAWWKGVMAAAVAGWPWLLGMVACLALAFAGVAWDMRASDNMINK